MHIIQCSQFYYSLILKKQHYNNYKCYKVFKHFFCIMNEFTFDNFNIFTTQKFENLTQAQATCSKNNGEIINLDDLNFETFSKFISTDQASNLKNYLYLRVRPVDSTLDQCYGLLNLFFLNVEGGFSENVNNVCREDDEFINGRFNTMCIKEQSNSSNSNAVSAQTLIVPVIIGVSVFVFVALIFGLFVYNKRKRRLSKIRQHASSLVEQQVINESEKVSFFLIK